MIVAACRVQLHLPTCDSLKAKRSALRPLLGRLRREFDLAAAETDHQDVWRSAEIALVGVANDAGHVRAMLEKAVAWIVKYRPDVEVVDYQIEFR